MQHFLMRPLEGREDSGMTLIEIIVVMALVGGLMAVILGGIGAGNRNARIRSTELAFGQLRSSMQMYKLQNTKYPTTEQGLKALVENPGINTWRGPYCEPEILKDAWGLDIQFEGDGRKMKFLSAGEDGEFGTPDDVAWPNEKSAS